VEPAEGGRAAVRKAAPAGAGLAVFAGTDGILVWTACRMRASRWTSADRVTFAARAGACRARLPVVPLCSSAGAAARGGAGRSRAREGDPRHRAERSLGNRGLRAGWPEGAAAGRGGTHHGRRRTPARARRCRSSSAIDIGGRASTTHGELRRSAMCVNVWSMLDEARAPDRMDLLGTLEKFVVVLPGRRVPSSSGCIGRPTLQPLRQRVQHAHTAGHLRTRRGRKDGTQGRDRERRQPTILPAWRWGSAGRNRIRSGAAVRLRDRRRHRAPFSDWHSRRGPQGGALRRARALEAVHMALETANSISRARRAASACARRFTT